MMTSRSGSLTAGAVFVLAGMINLSCKPGGARPPGDVARGDATSPERAAAPGDALERGLATIDGEQLAAHVAVLASDEFEGRFPGSAGEIKTISYLSAQLARVGVGPGNGASYLQEVPLVATTAAGTHRVAIRRGPRARAQALDVPGDVLVSSERPRERLTLEGAELVFVGHGVVAPEYGWDDYGDVDVRGRVVLVLGGDPGAARGDPAFFKGRAMSHYGTFEYKKDEARRRGAVGVLAIHAEDTSGVPWSTVASGAGKTKYRLASASASLDLQGIIRGAKVDELIALAGRDPAALREAATQPGFRAAPLGLTLDAELRHEIAPVRSHNVVGLIRGSQRPDEYVLYTAHWDHVGVAERDDGDGDRDRVFNGAIDNATGTAALLELAEAFAALERPPARSIVFLATTAEEQGLLGASHYVDHPLFPLPSTVGVINMDALFPFGETRGMTVVALGSSELEEYMAEAAKRVDCALYPDPSPELGAFFRSDHYPFVKRGVPALFAVGGPSPEQATGESALIQRFIHYLQTGYHKPADEYDPKTWDMAGIVQDVMIYFHTGYRVASDTRFPNWYEGSEFRPLRDAMRAGLG